ncbi:MAG: Asp-tRNA(Asn)/Glu-tRNA(Gln) amidotransferase GatCAB subunit B, partial [Arenicella sp.]|nr:Asp-tRNA(Asn)/Glu-tRNA(Gln) amidotransferase GatCAB subunit B [Arenicella sp.]
LKQITDTSAIEAVVDEVIASCPEQVQQFKDGNEKVIGFLVGQVMKKSRGKANPQMANEMLQAKLV